MEHHDAFWAHMHAFDRLAKKLSPDRFTMFPPPGPANKIKGLLETRVGDVADTHYSFKFVQELNETGKLTEPKSWQGPFETLTRQQLLDRGWCGVWFSSEYGLMNYPPDVLNGPYLSIIGDVLENPLSGKNSQQVFIDRVGREWGIMRDDPACLGGAFFPWMCSGSGDAWGWMLWGEDADWGVVTHDLLPKPSFWALRVIYSPVILPQRTTWKPGQTELVLPVRNLYNAIDLSACTFRTMLGGGMPFIGQLRAWKDIPVSCAPGESVEVRVPIWNEKTLEALNSGSPAVCRCVILDPKGYRPITADVLIAPESLQDGRDAEVPIGPDANLAAL
jgi:hypothetical protein